MLVVQRKKSGLGYFLCRSDAKMHNSDNGSGRGGAKHEHVALDIRAMDSGEQFWHFLIVTQSTAPSTSSRVKVSWTKKKQVQDWFGKGVDKITISTAVPLDGTDSTSHIKDAFHMQDSLSRRQGWTMKTNSDLLALLKQSEISAEEGRHGIWMGVEGMKTYR